MKVIAEARVRGSGPGRSLVVLCGCTSLIGSPVLADCARYSVELAYAPACFTDPPAWPWGLSENGQVCGEIQNCNGDERAFDWASGPLVTPLQLGPGVASAEALGINSSNEIVGTRSGSPIGLRGFFHVNGVTTIIEPFPGGTHTEALAISENGVVAGYWGNGLTGIPWGLHGFIWQDGQMTDLDIPHNNEASAINEKNQVTGYMYNLTGPLTSAFLYDNGKLTNLGVIPGGTSAAGRAINNNAHVAGYGRVPYDNEIGFVRHAFIWRNGAMTDIGVLPGGSESYAYGINDSDCIVGYSPGPKIIATAFVWRNGVMTSLNDLVPPDTGIRFITATAINNSGQITAVAEDENGQLASVLLTPITPAPGDPNCDGQVNMDDVLGVINQWGPTIPTTTADFNNDGTVGVDDLMEVIRGWTL